MPKNRKKPPSSKKIQPKALKYRELRKRLKPYGIIEADPKRGKGSERVLLRPIRSGSRRGPFHTIKCHGEGDEITIPVINAIFRRFNIDPEEFWS